MTGSDNKELRLEWTIQLEYHAVLANVEELLGRPLRTEEVTKAMSLMETPDDEFKGQLDNMRVFLKGVTAGRIMKGLEK